MDFGKAIAELGESALALLLRITVAVILLFVSYRIINLAARKIRRLDKFKSADKTLVKTLVYAVQLLLKLLVIIALVSFLGIDTSGLTALIASLGVGIGLAVNGALSNLAGGVILIVTRPFRIDDFIEAEGYSGTVVDIRVTATKLLTPDNKVVYIPNGALSAGHIINYSEMPTRRLDLEFTVPNGSDTDTAQRVILDTALRDGRIMKEPEPSARIKSFTDVGTVIFLRAWLKKEDYWAAFYDITEGVKSELLRCGIEPPDKKINVTIREGSYDKDRYKGKN